MSCLATIINHVLKLHSLVYLLAITAMMSTSPAWAAGECKKYYKKYSAEPDIKVMVRGKTKNGYYCWWNGGFSSLEGAKKSLLAHCRKEANSCVVVYATNEKKYWSKLDRKVLCDKALAGGNRSTWETHPNYVEHLAEAKRRGLSVDDCRLAIGLSTSSQKTTVSSFSQEQVCRQALSSPKNDTWDTGSSYVRYVDEAKRRGLSVEDCRVAIGLDVITRNMFSGLDNEALCMRALDASRREWEARGSFVREIEEAKRRGLSVSDCRSSLGLDVTIQNTLSGLDNKALCMRALDTSRREWEARDSFVREIEEAQRRGLSIDGCRDELGLVDWETTQPISNPEKTDLVVPKTDVIKPIPVPMASKSLTEICEKLLNSEKTDWSKDNSDLELSQSKDELGLTVELCRRILGVGGQSEVSDIALADMINQNCEATINQYSFARESKAFAYSRSKMTCYWAAGADSINTAQRNALAECSKMANDCSLVDALLAERAGVASIVEQKSSENGPNAVTGGRIALVVGINNYDNLPQLQKAVNDSRAVSRTLTEIGYDVIAAENPDRRTLSKKLSELQSKIKPGDNALFYFAGHGVALGGENILIAADMPKPNSGDEDLVRDEGFSVDDIVRRIQRQGAKTAFLVLDACRDNPFEASGTRSIGGTRGLEKTDAPSGVFVLFSAGIGQAALDRLGDSDSDPNSVFTRMLVPVLSKRGLTLTGIAKAVQKDVADLAASINHQQQPAYYDQIIGEVVINPQ